MSFYVSLPLSTSQSASGFDRKSATFLSSFFYLCQPSSGSSLINLSPDCLSNTFRLFLFLMNFWLIEVTLTLPLSLIFMIAIVFLIARFYTFDFIEHFLKSSIFTDEKLHSSSEIRWDMFEEVQTMVDANEVNPKKEEKHASVIDVVSHNRRRSM